MCEGPLAAERSNELRTVLPLIATTPPIHCLSDLVHVKKQA